MKIEYQNFAEILVDYPETYGLCVSHRHLYDNDGRGIIMETFLEVHICMNEEAFCKSVSYSPKHWHKVQVTPHESWFTSLEDYAPLQGLKIWLDSTNAPETVQFYAQRQASFHALTRLKHLELKQVNQDFMLYVPNLPTLRTLDLGGCYNLQFEGLLSLEAFAIGQTRHIDMNALSRNLNPDTLRHLAIVGIFNIHAPNELLAFPRLKTLEMSYNLDALKQIPIALEKCKALETLHLIYNKLATLPTSMLELSTLKELTLDGTPLKIKKIIAKEADIIDLIQQDTTLDIKQKLWAILLEDTKVTKKYTFTDLLQLLVSTTHKTLLKKINTLLESNLKQNPLDNLPAFDRVALVGKLPAMSFTEVRNMLKRHNISLTSSISSDIQVVCVGEGITHTEVGKLLAMSKKPVLCLPTHFKAFLQTLEKPYLVDTTDDIAENLGNLLISNDKTNVTLALQMIKTGGLPAGFLEFLYLLWFEDIDWQEHIGEVLRRYSTFVQFETIYKYIKKQDFRGLDELFKSKHFNQVDLVKMALRYFLPRAKQDKNNSLLWHLEKKLWNLKGALMEQVIEHQLQTDGTLHLGRYQFHFKIPAVLVGNDRIKKLVIQRDFNLYQPRTLQKLIQSLPALTDLAVIVPSNEHVTQEEKEQYERKFPALHIYIVEDR